MTGIKAAGTGSGLDIQSLVSQLVAAERQPLDARITRARSTANTEISALGTLKSSMSALRDAVANVRTPSAFASRLVTSSEPAVLTATASAEVAPGTYDVEVVNLAAAQKLASDPFAGGADAAVGSGILKIACGDVSFDVLVDASHGTLAGIRDAINQAGGNTMVSASLLNEAGGTRLILTSRGTGADSAFSITQSGGNGGLSRLVYDPLDPGSNTLTETTAARDAKVRIDGYVFESASNLVTGAVDGLGISLKKAQEGTTYTLTIADDASAMMTKVKKFVADFNALAKTLRMLQAYDPATGKSGTLLGDAFAQGLDSQIRRDATATVAGLAGPYANLASIGITTNDAGLLVVDDDLLAHALAKDFAGVTRVFAGDGGVAQRLYDRLDGALDSSATMATRTEALNKRLKTLQSDQDKVDLRMESVQARYEKQFAALDTLMAQMNTTSSYLASVLSKRTSD